MRDKVDPIGVVVLVLLVLGIIGLSVYAVRTALNREAKVCTSEVIALPSPTSAPLMIDALTMLIEEGLVPSKEVALASLEGAQYIFDPEEHELEYWVYLRNRSQLWATEFNFTCQLEEENYPLDLEYEGMRVIG